MSDGSAPTDSAVMPDGLALLAVVSAVRLSGLLAPVSPLLVLAVVSAVRLSELLAPVSPLLILAVVSAVRLSEPLAPVTLLLVSAVRQGVATLRVPTPCLHYLCMHQ